MVGKNRPFFRNFCMILYSLPAKSWPILRIRAILKTVNLWPTTLKKCVDVSADLRPLNCELFLCDFIHILLNFDFSFFQCSCQSKTSMFQIMNIISFFISFKIHQSELELSSQWELESSNQSELDRDFIKTSLYDKDCHELFWLEVSKYYFQPLRLAFLLSNFFGLNFLVFDQFYFGWFNIRSAPRRPTEIIYPSKNRIWITFWTSISTIIYGSWKNFRRIGPLKKSFLSPKSASYRFYLKRELDQCLRKLVNE